MRKREVVSTKTFHKCIDEIAALQFRSFDTETTGLYPYHDDRPFSVAISTQEKDYYFNWNEYASEDIALPQELVLDNTHWSELAHLSRSGFGSCTTLNSTCLCQLQWLKWTGLMCFVPRLQAA